MTDDLALVLERARQNRASGFLRRVETSDARAARPVVSDSTLRAGDRVFDLVLGQDGIVDGATPTRDASGATIVVQLRDGRSVTRAPEQLLPRPTPPNA